VLIQVQDGHVSALTRKVHRNGTADARVATCVSTAVEAEARHCTVSRDTARERPRAHSASQRHGRCQSRHQQIRQQTRQTKDN
jgi:hypothetical protein